MPPVRMEWHPLPQPDGPGATILRHLPILGQPGVILAGVGVDLKEPLEGWVMLDIVVGCPDNPGTHIIPVGEDQAHHQAVYLGLAGFWCGRQCLGYGKHQDQQQ